VTSSSTLSDFGSVICTVIDESGATLHLQRMGRKALSTILLSSRVDNLYAIMSFSFVLRAANCGRSGHIDKAGFYTQGRHKNVAINMLTCFVIPLAPS
jgi:hypothetical protein